MTTSTALDNLIEYVMAATDWKMLRVIAAAVFQTGSELGQTRGFDPIGDIARVLAYVGSDMNASDAARDGREGVFRVPQETQDGRRHGVREFVLDTIAAGYPLTLKTRALVTGVTFDRSGARPRATGVEWEDGGMDREHGAAESCAFVKKIDFPPSNIVFDAQFDKAKQKKKK